MSKIEAGGVLEQSAGKKRAFQYAFSSRNYWKILEFSPLFGVKEERQLSELQ